MAQITVNVLASDFEGNSYDNIRKDMQGCPLQRAFMRAGIVKEGKSYCCLPDKIYDNLHGEPDSKVLSMFNGIIPVEDFSFTVEV